MDDLFERLSKSKFRSGFRLKQKDMDYVADKGMDTIREHASNFISKRLASAVIENDGKQTPTKGHPVFIAQHATACCCRGCLSKWHHIPQGRELTQEEQSYVVQGVMAWIEKEMVGYKPEKMEEYEQLSLFEEEIVDTRSPITVNWNLWHGCTRTSAGCLHCYMYRRDESIGKDPSVVQKTGSFNLPVRKIRSGEHKGKYKVPKGSHFDTCFSSDFFHPDADEWREEAWNMIRERSDCTFFMITKRPERIAEHLPADWRNGWEHVTIAVTCENQEMIDKRLPVYLSLPVCHHAVMIEPMLTAVNLRPYINEYRAPDGSPLIKLVTAGGESGAEARTCDYEWVKDVQTQCVENGISFYYHQTGAKLIKDGKLYSIPRQFQHLQAHKAGLDV